MTGERWEAYSQLLFLRARYYEPAIGRFVGKDLWSGNIEHPITLHDWVYAQNNPIVYVDPTGHQGVSSSLLPKPPPPCGKYWKYVGEYSLTAYGHPVHGKFAIKAEEKNREATEQGQPEPWPMVDLQWRDAVDQTIYTSRVSSLWLENVRPETGEGTAGKLEGTEKGTVFINCVKGYLICNEQTEEEAKSGAARTRLRPYKDGAINKPANKDLVLRDTVFIAGGAGVISIMDHGTGKPPINPAKWIDIYVGEHGYHDWNKSILGTRKIWVLKPIPYPPPCDWSIPPNAPLQL